MGEFRLQTSLGEDGVIGEKFAHCPSHSHRVQKVSVSVEEGTCYVKASLINESYFWYYTYLRLYRRPFPSPEFPSIWSSPAGTSRRTDQT